MYTSGNVNTFEGCFPSSVGKPREVTIARISIALARKILRCTNVCDSQGAIYQCTILLYCLLQYYCARWFGVRCAVTWWLFYFTRGRNSVLSVCLWGVCIFRVSSNTRKMHRQYEKRVFFNEAFPNYIEPENVGFYEFETFTRFVTIFAAIVLWNEVNTLVVCLMFTQFKNKFRVSQSIANVNIKLQKCGSHPFFLHSDIYRGGLKFP